VLAALAVGPGWRWASAAVAAGLAVTVTAGLAEFGPADTSTTLFWSADQSLLAAKRARPPVPPPRHGVG